MGHINALPEGTRLEEYVICAVESFLRGCF